MAASTIFINVSTGKPLDEVARAVVATVSGNEVGSVSIINQKGGLNDGEGVVIEFFESEGTEPLTIEKKFRVEG